MTYLCHLQQIHQSKKQDDSEDFLASSAKMACRTRGQKSETDHVFDQSETLECTPRQLSLTADDMWVRLLTANVSAFLLSGARFLP